MKTRRKQVVEFDELGLIISVKEYNALEKLIHYWHHKGYEEWWIYDERGKLIKNKKGAMGGMNEAQEG